jgi:hypothetical protein
LLASLLGHAAAFGDGHAMGGAHHGLLVALANVGVGGFVLAAISVAWAGRGAATDGSVLAARLACYVPGLPALGLCTAGWFSLAEATEGAHADGNLFLTVLALVLAAALVRMLARRAIEAIAAVVISICAPSFARRIRIRLLRLQRPLRIREAAHVRRRFARPPPSVTSRA